jgi:UDP-N-acetylmuramyl tripeptide synthase
MSRVSGRGGSSLPGLVARRIDPAVLSRLAQSIPSGTILVTGTNGKTTTTAMVRNMLEDQGRRVLSNRAGANLILGLTTAFMDTGWHIGPRADLALLETDEATMPAAARELRPRVVLVTNFFRDQLDRYGELTTTVQYVARGIAEMAENGTLIVNADDPQAAGLARGHARAVYFGMGGTFAPEPAGYDAVDARFCPQCGAELHYRRRFYAHIGDYQCPGCGWDRPDPQIRIEWWDRTSQQMALVVDGGEHIFSWRLPGLYNLYNQAAAIALGLTLGIDEQIVAQSLDNFRPAFGRMETLEVGGVQLWLALVKNPVGFNQVLSAVADDNAAHFSVMILINDQYADGRDVSWLWDVDFEHWMGQIHSDHWYVGGTRARDMAVRLKYAGIERVRITVEDNVARLLDQATQVPGAHRLYVLPTYTAMLEFRRLLTDRGLAPHFREG